MQDCRLSDPWDHIYLPNSEIKLLIMYKGDIHYVHLFVSQGHRGFLIFLSSILLFKFVYNSIQTCSYFCANLTYICMSEKVYLMLSCFPTFFYTDMKRTLLAGLFYFASTGQLHIKNLAEQISALERSLLNSLLVVSYIL